MSRARTGDRRRTTRRGPDPARVLGAVGLVTRTLHPRAHALRHAPRRGRTDFHREYLEAE